MGSPPNVEAIIVAALRADADVIAAVGAKVYGERPPDAKDPLLVVFRVPDGPLVADWLEQARIQVDAWGTTRTDAYAAASAASTALLGLVGVFDSGVLSGTNRVTGPFWLPDPATNRPRYIVEFLVHAHPLSAP